MKKLTVILILSLAFAAQRAIAQEPYVIKSYQVNEDASFVYYSDNLSDGGEKTRKVKKPEPKQYPASVTLIATNDYPVMIEYAYEELYADGRRVTNHIRRVKSERERAVITLPPMPELQPLIPEKTDALGLAAQRARLEKNPVTSEPIVTSIKTMRQEDRAIAQRVEGREIIYTLQSGAEVRAPIKKAYSARVQSAPIKAKNKPEQ